jgi:hypothetical protein
MKRKGSEAEAAAAEEDVTAAVRVGLVVEQELPAVCEGPGSACFFPFAFVNLGEEGPQLRQAVAGVILAGHNFLSIGEQSLVLIAFPYVSGL